jgi:pimeloyl-ACP methyl ester carboxylesterase
MAILYHKTHVLSPDAPWVTFIHGAGGSSNVWYKQVKDFSENFNVLLIDLRGHGKSSYIFEGWMKQRQYDFQDVCFDIIRVLDHLRIEKSHFVGISLGTIIIREISERHPERVNAMVLGGAVIRFNNRSRFLVWMSHRIKTIVPYMWIYKLYAFILMPKKRHKKSRSIFVKEAKKLYQKEFLRWIRITSQLKPVLKIFREKDSPRPIFYIMGAEDYMFLPSVQIAANQHANATLEILPNSGHVVNIDQADAFNKIAIEYLKKIS